LPIVTYNVDFNSRRFFRNSLIVLRGKFESQVRVGLAEMIP
jgi:hypothetical protein